MSKLSVCFLADLPDQVYPEDEFISQCYIVGYYVGSSFRVVGRFSKYASAMDVAEVLRDEGRSGVSVFRQFYHLQKFE